MLDIDPLMVVLAIKDSEIIEKYSKNDATRPRQQRGAKQFKMANSHASNRRPATTWRRK